MYRSRFLSVSGAAISSAMKGWPPLVFPSSRPEHLNAALAADKTPVVVNLASQEYFRSVDRKVLKARVVECVFEEWKGTGYKVISFNAKKARGLMARYAITRRVETPRKLEHFNLEGYAFDPAASQAERLVFRRRMAT